MSFCKNSELSAASSAFALASSAPLDVVVVLGETGIYRVLHAKNCQFQKLSIVSMRRFKAR